MDSYGAEGGSEIHSDASAIMASPPTSDEEVRFQLARAIVSQGFDVDSFVKLCAGDTGGTIEKAEFVLCVQNMGTFKISQILHLSKILLPQAVDSSENFKARVQQIMNDYAKVDEVPGAPNMSLRSED